MILAILLLPVCAGAVCALWRVLQQSGDAETIWVAIAAGAACWLVIYLLLPKPMTAYVFGHELTHVLWTWLFGGKVKTFKASSTGGHVIATKSNFVIALAPYFFPLYAVLVVAIFAVGQMFSDWRPYRAWFHLLLGAAYAFHITLTGYILKSSQSDITDQGYVFSAVVIFLGNISVLLLGIPILTGQLDLGTVLHWWLEGAVQSVQWLARVFSVLKNRPT